MDDSRFPDRAMAGMRALWTRRRVLAGAMGVAAGGVVRRFADAAAESQPAFPPALAVSRGPESHFFGYYDKCPWDKTGRYLLGMRVGFFDRDPQPGERLVLGTIDLRDGSRFKPFDETAAWSWQQGTMLQWVGSAADREVIYNSLEGDRYVSIIRDVHSGASRKLPRPIYAVSQDGTQAVTLDYERVNRLRPGYGYIALPEKGAEDPAPRDRGIYRMDLRSGESRLILDLRWASEHRRDERFEDAEHWFNHLQFNPSGTRFIFLHRWRKRGERPWHTRLYTAAPDGREPRLLSDVGMVSHFDWRDDGTILAWTRTEQHGPRFYLIDDVTGEHTVVGEGVLTHDGHCSYSPDRKWIINDTYPDRDGMQTLMLFRVADSERIVVGRFFQPEAIRGKPYRCDLHPRWNRDGTEICIDSTHEGSRQLYVIDVSGCTRGQGRQ
ncbi:MAG: hypothetical protein GXY55_07455 [Phycisphaerae bacterium]|nr:hypothetical protein [Phycisphaerae bacterium]